MIAMLLAMTTVAHMSRLKMASYTDKHVFLLL